MGEHRDRVTHCFTRRQMWALRLSHGAVGFGIGMAFMEALR